MVSVSLGSTVRTRSDGYPVVSGGSNTTVLIYTGSTPYHIEITDEDDVAIFPAKDNVKGALDTSSFLTTGSTSVLVLPALSKTANYTALAADKGKLIAANASGGFFTITLPSAITVGDGWNIGIRNDGTANNVGIAASQSIATPMGGTTAFSIRPGEAKWVASNGATYKVLNDPPRISGAYGVIVVADRLSTPPASPTPGARYTLTSSATGAWSTFAEHDIAEANGQGGWIQIVPFTDIGWVAYVQDEDLYYRFIGSAWRVESASDTTPGTLEIAVQSEVETATDVLRAVAPGRQHFHPGHPKAWGKVNSDGTIQQDWNVASVSHDATGDYTVTLDITMADTTYAVLATSMPDSESNNRSCHAVIVSTTQFSIFSKQGEAGSQDSDFSFMVLGDILGRLAPRDRGNFVGMEQPVELAH